MDNTVIVTITREYGSGGSTIGKILAKELDCPFYDKDLLTLAAEESGIHKDLFSQADEKPGNRFFDAMAASSGAYGMRHTPLHDLPMRDQLFLIQSQTIRSIAEKGSCVLVGRCADHILMKDPRTLRVYIHAPYEERLHRVINSYQTPAQNAPSEIDRIDKERAQYYSHYTHITRGVSSNYHISIDSSVLGLVKTADLLFTLIEMRRT